MILAAIASGEIDISRILEEKSAEGATGAASMSRFQLLIFTFVIAGLYLLLSIEAGTFVDIPNNVLGLLGISGGSFLVSKGMSGSQKKKPDVEITEEDPSGTKVTVKK